MSEPLKADVYSMPDLELTEDKLRAFLDQLPAMDAARQARNRAMHALVAAWMPVLYWLYRERREEDGERLGLLISQIAAFGAANLTQFEWAHEIWDQYRAKELGL